MTLERFRGDYPEWDRYTLTHTQRDHRQDGRDPARDRREGPPLGGGGEVDPSARARRVHELALPRAQAAGGIGGRLHEAESMGHLLTCLFALEGRVRPFHDYLEWELEQYPLEGWDDLLDLLEGDQHELFRRVEAHVRAHGLGAVVDSWEPDVPFMRGER